MTDDGSANTVTSDGISSLTRSTEENKDPAAFSKHASLASMWADHTRSDCLGLFLVINADVVSVVFVDIGVGIGVDIDVDVLTETICT